MVLGVLLVVAGVVSSVVPVDDMLMAAIIVTIAVGAALVPMCTATCCSAAIAVRGKLSNVIATLDTVALTQNTNQR
ncbi:MAG: hypothetical protein ACLSUZ_03000 [Bifidobacterium pseudocatenulatum]